MTQGIKALRKIALGREATAGTAVAATTIWRGIGTIEDQQETVFAEEDIGYLAPVDRQYVPKLQGAVTMESTPATFEQLLHIFEAGVKRVQTGSADGAGSGKVYTYTMPTTTANTLRTYTIEGGDNAGAEEVEYCFVDQFTIEGNGGEALMVSADWIGRQVSTSTFTGGATIPDVEEIIFSKGYLYIDTVGGTIGATTVANTLLSMSLSVDTGIQPVFSADGNKYFAFSKVTRPEVTLELTYEHNTSSIAEKAAWKAGTPRQLRLKFIGSAFTTAGTYSNKTLIIDLVGKYEAFSAIEDADGNDTVTATFKGGYNSTAAKFCEFKVANLLTSVP